MALSLINCLSVSFPCSVLNVVFYTFMLILCLLVWYDNGWEQWLSSRGEHYSSPPLVFSRLHVVGESGTKKLKLRPEELRRPAPSKRRGKPDALGVSRGRRAAAKRAVAKYSIARVLFSLDIYNSPHLKMPGCFVDI
jgi:hypothetical protein